MSTYLDELARELYGFNFSQEVWDEKCADLHADAEVLRDAIDVIYDLRQILADAEVLRDAIDLARLTRERDAALDALRRARAALGDG